METLESTQLVPFHAAPTDAELEQELVAAVRKFEESKANCDSQFATVSELVQVKMTKHMMISIDVTKRHEYLTNQVKSLHQVVQRVLERTDQEIQHVQKSKIAKSHSRGNVGATLFYLYLARCGAVTHGRHSFSCINFEKENGAVYILVSYTWLQLVELLYTQGKILLDKVKFPPKWRTIVSSELKRLGAEEHKGDAYTTFFPILESCKGKRNRVFKLLFSHILPNMRVAFEGQSGLVRDDAAWTLSHVPETFQQCDTSLDTICNLLFHRSYRGPHDQAVRDRAAMVHHYGQNVSQQRLQNEAFLDACRMVRHEVMGIQESGTGEYRGHYTHNWEREPGVLTELFLAPPAPRADDGDDPRDKDWEPPASFSPKSKSRKRGRSNGKREVEEEARPTKGRKRLIQMVPGQEYKNVEPLENDPRPRTGGKHPRFPLGIATEDSDQPTPKKQKAIKAPKAVKVPAKRPAKAPEESEASEDSSEDAVNLKAIDSAPKETGRIHSSMRSRKNALDEI